MKLFKRYATAWIWLTAALINGGMAVVFWNIWSILQGLTAVACLYWAWDDKKKYDYIEKMREEREEFLRMLGVRPF